MFSMALLGSVPTTVEEVALPHLDPVNDTIITLFATVCEALQDWGTLRFAVSGFGDPSWAVDIYTDLAVVLEQLPDVYRWLLQREIERLAQRFIELGTLASPACMRHPWMQAHFAGLHGRCSGPETAASVVGTCRSCGRQAWRTQ